MKSAVVVPTPAPDVEALIKEARRRQRRRYAAIGVAAVAVLAAALGAVPDSHGASTPRQASQPRPRPAAGHSVGPHAPGPIPGSVNTTVLMWPAASGQDGVIALDNLRTGQRGQATPVVDPGENQPIMLIGGWIVYVSDNSVRATNAATGKTRVLGRTLAFASSAAPGDAWVEYGYYEPSTAAVPIRWVPVAGGGAGPPITLPRGTQLIAGTAAGLLLEPRFSEVCGPFWLWTPGTAPKALPYSSSAEGFAVVPRLVAYGGNCTNPSTAQDLGYGGNFGYYACRILRVFNVVTGRLQSFAAPAGTTGWAPT